MTEKSAARDASALASLRDALLDAQSQLHRDKANSIVLIVSGVAAAGRSEVVNQLLEWLDPKHISVHARGADCLSRTRPPMWRFWNTLPRRGALAIYFLGWYEDYLLPALLKPKKLRRNESRVLERILQMESMLPQDHVRVVKLHLRVSKKIQRQRLSTLCADKRTRWRVTLEDRWFARHHDRVEHIVQRYLEVTSHRACRWHVIDGSDPDQRAFEVGSILLQEMRAANNAITAVQPPLKRSRIRAAVAAARRPAESTQNDYESELERLQGRLALLVRRRAFRKRGAVLAFEGMDAAGKGGTIRRVTAALDARQYNVLPVSAPTAEELAYPYLWRFWRNIPDAGHIAIFDRSWYGRVLVERVRELTPPARWQRAYDEIREFELQLAENQLIVQKFWLAVSAEEQLKRFRQRDEDPLKRFKVDPEDWENRRFYAAYQTAAGEMIKRTHTDYAPWSVVDADDKKSVRLQVLNILCERIERALD